MATKARQQYFADEISLQKQRREFSLEDNIKQKIDSVEAGAQVNTIETVKVNGTALTPDANKAVNVEVPDVIDNLYSTSADDALSAKQGKVLYDYIQNIASRGRFLSNWNSATGLPMTNPSESPYPYKSGDYFVVSNVAGLGGTNYRPDGSSYIIGQASAVVETEDVSVSDFYFYDGTNWLLLSNSGRQIAIDSSLSTTSTNPVENRVITNALNGKQDTLIAGSHIDITNNVVSTTGLQEELTPGDNITIEDVCTTESDMKGPAPSGFHVPLQSEWTALCGILTTIFSMASNATTIETYLKMPMAGSRNSSTASVEDAGSKGRYWSSTPKNNTDTAYDLYFASSIINPQAYNERARGYPIRCFKDTPVIPTSSWTTLYQGAGNAGIFWDSTGGLISVSGDGVAWHTIMDKNLGATAVFNQGDILTDTNCGYFYQWGNNYGFPYSGNVTTSNTQVDASNYGPGNYYSNSTFIKRIYDYDRSSVQNDNLWGGVTQGTWQDCVYNLISATDTTYTAGTGINIDSNNVISTTITPGQTYTAGNGINIDSNNEISNTLPGAIVSATAPSSPTEGMVWYDTTNDALKAYNGTSWETEGTKMAVLEYGVSTWQDFIDAYNENAIVYCKVSSGSSGYRMAFMAYTAGQGTPTEVEFQYYRSRSSHSTAANQLDEVYVYKLTNAGVWTTTQRDTGAEMIAGTGIGITFNSSGMTIANTGVTSVNNQTGAVTVLESQTKVFPMPEVGDDISDLVSWLSAGKVAVLFDGDMTTPGDYEGAYYQIGYWDETNYSIVCYQTIPGNSSINGKTIFYSSNIVDDITSEIKLLAPHGGTNGQVLTQTSQGVPSWQTPSGGDVVVSSQTGNILQSGMKIWAGLETDYGNLGTYDSNTLYLTVE